MDCVEMGLLTEEDLMMYAAGDADARIIAHVESCTACRAQAAKYAAEDARLRLQLYRVDCPTTQTLGDLALELLAPEEALHVHQHLALCTHCAEELTILRRELREDPMSAQLRQPGPIARLAARLLQAPGHGATAYMGVRGDSSGTTMTYEAEDITFSLTTEVDGVGTKRRWTLLGLVLTNTGDPLPDGVTAHLLRGEAPAGGVAVDEVGNLVIAGLEAGVYTLELVVGERVIVVEKIQIGQ